MSVVPPPRAWASSPNGFAKGNSLAARFQKVRPSCLAKRGKDNRCVHLARRRGRLTLSRSSNAAWAALALVASACGEDAKTKAYNTCHAIAITQSSSQDPDQVVIATADYMPDCMAAKGYRYQSHPGCSIPSSQITRLYYYQLKDMAACYVPAGETTPTFTLGN
jgi:hypothetical protein